MKERLMNRDERMMPIVALREMLVLPGMLMHFDVNRKITVEAVEQAMLTDQMLFLVTQENEEAELPDVEDLYKTGTIAIVKQMVRMPGNAIRVMVLGIDRARLVKLTDKKPYLQGIIETQEDEGLEEYSERQKKAMAQTLLELIQEYAKESNHIGDKTLKRLKETTYIPKMTDEVAALLPLDLHSKQNILGEFNSLKRYNMLAEFLVEEIDITKYRKELQAKVKGKVDKNQREYLLREQMKVIREELGEGDILSEVEEFKEKFKQLEAGKEIKNKIWTEIERYRMNSGSSAESAVTRGYIETLLSLPWEKCSEDSKDLVAAKQLLEEEHYGLTKVKERVVEALAVRMLTSNGNSPILCLVGPPGTGKTSIAHSIADALHKKYIRVCLGGVRDEAEIRGHRRTYVGSMPGRIVTALKNAGVKNPLMLLDEIDKVGNDQRGDTASALLEVLDTEQNDKFVDHYVELPVDLSKVLFIATANSLQTIPKPLLDRMEIIEVSSYTENEKYQIAKKYLLKKQLWKNGLDSKQITIDKKAMELLIHGYTREAGVRQLERTIGKICRKVATEALEAAIKEGNRSENPIEDTKVRITTKNIEHYLGKVKYHINEANKKPAVGIVRGLAWTSVGGDTLEIEVNVMPGKGKLSLTGKLGNVMKESAQIALTYVRSLSEQYKIENDYFEKHDIHIHVPEGATPKDGPSAGITMATAIFSAVTGKKVRADIAMTGEVTLRGRVLPIGGLKEKILAGKQAKLKTILVPMENQKDIEELDEEITQGLEILFVEDMKEVLSYSIKAK